LAISIACLGLIGLASFTAERRKKEVGIRKVLGASHTNLIVLLTKEFTLLGNSGISGGITYRLANHAWLVAGFCLSSEYGRGRFSIIRANCTYNSLVDGCLSNGQNRPHKSCEGFAI